MIFLAIMERPFDFLIVGSGLGGLVSALILAKEGKKVCVLEKNPQFGGNLQTFARDKLIFDTGVHYIGGLEKGQNLYRYFDFLGIAEDLKLVKLDADGYDFVTFDGDRQAYPHAMGAENFVRKLTELFPEEKENLKNYVIKIGEVCAAFPGYRLDLLSPYNPEYLYENAKEFINSVTKDCKLRAVLSGSNFLYAGNGKTPLPVHALTVNSYMQSAFRCIRGGSQITKLLVKELRKHGADIYKNSEVFGFIFNKNNEILGVKTKDGRTFFAENFISNIDISALLKILGEKKVFPKSFTERISLMKPTVACFSLYISLKPGLLPYFNHNIYHFKNEESVWSASLGKAEDWPENYMISCAVSPKNRGFAESMTVLAYMNFDEVKEWQSTENTAANPDFRGKSYEAFKNKKAQILLNKIEEKFPNLSEKIRSVYTSTPLTYRDYIGSQNGAIYGYEKDSDNPMKTTFSPKTKVKNLFLTGQTVNMHGILGVTIGAFNTCAEILGRDYLQQKLDDYEK